MRYLCISFLRKMNGQIDEMISMTKRIKPSDRNSANVILDFAEKKVTKCIIEGKEIDTTFGQMRDYYHRIYPDLINQLEREATIVAEVDKQADKLNKIRK